VLLTERQREKLTQIGTRLRVPSRAIVYREGGDAGAVFAVSDGVLRSYRDLASGRRSVSAFLFARDLFGLAKRGRYVNSTQAITPATIYRLPIDALTAILKQDGALEFQFLVKVMHELREANRRNLLLMRRDAAGRLEMFLALMADHQDVGASGIVPLPMTRSDIADFLNLSLESVSRASADLQHRGLVAFKGRHVAMIVNPAGFARLVAEV